MNSYWDDGSHIPFEPRRPLRELGGRPLHDVSMHLRGPIVSELEAMFAHSWSACGETETKTRRPQLAALRADTAAAIPGMRLVCDAPYDILPGSQNGSMHMLRELLEESGVRVVHLHRASVSDLATDRRGARGRVAPRAGARDHHRAEPESRSHRIPRVAEPAAHRARLSSIIRAWVYSRCGAPACTPIEPGHADQPAVHPQQGDRRR